MPDFSCREDFFFTDFYKDYIGTNLTDLIPGNDKFLIRSQKSAKTKGSGNDDRADASLLFIEDQVVDFSETFAVTTVDHIFFF